MQEVTNLKLWELTDMVGSQEWKDTMQGRYLYRYLTEVSPSFHGINSIAEIQDILNKEVTKGDGTIQNNKVFDMVPDVCGAVCNIDAYLQGQPEDMFSFVHSESNIVQDLNLYLSVPYSVNAKDIQSAANRIRKYIENKPTNVSLNINLRTDYRQSNWSPYGPVKSIILDVARADDYLTDQVVNILSHVCLFRYFICTYIFLTNNSNGRPEKAADGWVDFMTFNKTWEP